jgi:TPR repeat protein
MSLSGLSAPPSPVIRVQAGLGELRVSDVSGTPGEPILLKIELLGAGDAEQLFILRGIPKGVKLTPGGSVGNFWAVNSKVISSLTLTAPLDYTGSFKVSISRTQDTAASAQFASFTVTIAPQAVPETVSAAATQVAKAAKTIRQPDPNEQMLMARGTTLFKGGDVSAARGIFEYLAAQGSPAAAIAMGETYDPVILEKLVIRGLEANADKAREWYRQAESLGSDEAGGRLNALARR